MVSTILKQKCDQEWKFPTAWDNFPTPSVTSEPPKIFQLEGGRFNEIFEEYCKTNGIPFPPGRKIIFVYRSNDNVS